MNADNNWSQKREKQKTDSIFASTGQEILDEVTRAVNEGNYTGLAESLSERINGAVYGAANGFAKKLNIPRQHPNNPPARQNGNGPMSRQNGNGPMPQQNANGPIPTYRGSQAPFANQAPQYFLSKNVTDTRGRHRRILGLLGMILFGILSIIFGISMTVSILSASVAVSIVLAIFFAGNLFGFLHFRKIDKEGKRYTYLVDEYYRYGQTIGAREYFMIKELAQLVLEQPETTRQNLIDMKKYDMLPQAFFDAQYSTVLLTNHARTLYQNVLNSYMAQKQHAASAHDQNGAAAGGKDSAMNAEVQKLLKEGDAYIRKIRAINNEIPDSAPMSAKLSRLENVTASMFATVKRDPKKAKDLRRVMSYYLPTTEKLLDAYMDFWRSPSQSDQKKQTMAEIEQSVDTVCDGFERVLAKITEPDVMDISSDISVMKHMMEQDGMTTPDLKV